MGNGCAARNTNDSASEGWAWWEKSEVPEENYSPRKRDLGLLLGEYSRRFEQSQIQHFLFRDRIRERYG